MSNNEIRLHDFLRRLERAKLYHRLNRVRDGFIMVEIDIPGERWEVEFSEDGQIEVEIFTSDGEIHEAEVLERLFENDE